MELTESNRLRRLIVVGDRVLIRPKQAAEKTAGGILLPPGVQERERIQTGYVVKTGPGYPIPMAAEEEEIWKPAEEKTKYIPLQAVEGDLAIFLQKGAIELEFDREKYFIVPQASILMLEREEDL